MAQVPNDPCVAEVVARWCARVVFRIGSETIKSRTFLRRMWAGAVFFPRRENEEFLDEVMRVMDELRQGQINHCTARWLSSDN